MPANSSARGFCSSIGPSGESTEKNYRLSKTLPADMFPEAEAWLTTESKEPLALTRNHQVLLKRRSRRSESTGRLIFPLV